MGEVEDSQLEDHTHEDPGHSHGCNATSVADPHHHNTGLKTRVHKYAAGDDEEAASTQGDMVNTQDTLVKVTTTCNTNPETSGLGGVSGNSGSETRPINMKV